MYRYQLAQWLKAHLDEAMLNIYGKVPLHHPELPPDASFGDIAFHVAMPLAPLVRQNPRKIADRLVAELPSHPLIRYGKVEGPGYMNFHLHQGRYLRYLLEAGLPFSPKKEKAIVEHTNINPNKAAHIGHLRNAILGDTLARVLKKMGYPVEVHNYIDDTGVQVADVVAGLLHLEERSWEEIKKQYPRVDYYTWNLYARIQKIYEEDPATLAWRKEVLKAIEEGKSPIATLAEDVAMTIMERHLQTMERLGITYDLLPRERDILARGFWEDAFRRLKNHGAIYRAKEGKEAGCWCLPMAGEKDKILVRSDGTLTYTAKDIAYQLWKLGLIERDFAYLFYRNTPWGTPIWRTASEKGSHPHPPFGKGDWVYNVIDVRQEYPQRVVKEAVKRLGYADRAEKSIHFAYEMVALSEKCAEELGFSEVGQVGMSGRKGLGVKADDLLDLLEKKSQEEVLKRQTDLSEDKLSEITHAISVGALKFFMLKYGINKVIAFDFEEALNFDGDTGPYVQYSLVRGKSIEEKLIQAGKDITIQDEAIFQEKETLEAPLWHLVRACGELPLVADKSVKTLDFSLLTRFSLDLATLFHRFYQHCPILHAEDETRYLLRWAGCQLFRKTQKEVLEMLGIPIPERM